MYDIVIGIIFIIFTVLNIVRLARSAEFLKAAKQNRLFKCTARIVWRFGILDRDLFSTVYAKAEYSVDGEVITGRLFAPARIKLIEGQQTEVIAAIDFPKMFACSEKHIKSAFAKYVFLTVLTLATAILCVMFWLNGAI